VDEDGNEVLIDNTTNTELNAELNKNIAGVEGNEDEEEMEDFVARAEGDEILIGTEPEVELSQYILKCTKI
jgi:predicted phosphodiesterase